MTKIKKKAMSFQFKGSKYDFDHILAKRGYEISQEYEDRIVFSKPVKLDNNNPITFSEDEMKKMAVNVSRPKVIISDSEFEITSPYIISYNYFVIPHHSIRRVRWDTFPGNIPDIFEAMLGIAEEESRLCGNVFLQTDSLIIQTYTKTKKADS